MVTSINHNHDINSTINNSWLEQQQQQQRYNKKTTTMSQLAKINNNNKLKCLQ
eukprot:m.74092 g.74092  ORF g.74092 m.74092 type:complete len:53 (-) comp12447_c0_seq1:22-180(-)